MKIEGKIELTYLDRTFWRAGEWDNEPDTIVFNIEDYVCFINRAPNGGFLRGYVIIDKNRECYSEILCFYKKDTIKKVKEEINAIIENNDLEDKITIDIDDYSEYPSECHGGITFYHEEDRIYPLFSENQMILGFDCSHGEDHQRLKEEISSYQSYKNINYVKNNLKILVSELKLIKYKGKQ